MNRQPILFCGILIFTQNYISQLILSNWFQRSFLHKTPFAVNHQNLFVKFKCDLSREWKLLNIQLILVIIVICFFLQNHITIQRFTFSFIFLKIFSCMFSFKIFLKQSFIINFRWTRCTVVYKNKGASPHFWFLLIHVMCITLFVWVFFTSTCHFDALTADQSDKIKIETKDG